MSQNRPPATAARKLLGRAYGVAAVVGAAIVAVTAVFVSRIADSSATAGSGTGGGTSSPTQAPGNIAPNGQFDPGQPYYGGGGQLSVPQQNQPPVGGSHGS